MARPMETQMTISCLQCDWSVEAVNTSVQESSAFLEAAYTHADQHEQHALEDRPTAESVQRELRRASATHQPRHSTCRG